MFKNFSVAAALILGSITANVATAAPTSEVGVDQVLGQMFVTSSGSSSGSFLMTVGVEAKSRNTVEVTYLEGHRAWSDGNVTALETPDKPSFGKLMINCKGERYSPAASAQDGYSTKTYFAGNTYKWGDYSKMEIFAGSKDEDNFSKYLALVCSYTAQY